MVTRRGRSAHWPSLGYAGGDLGAGAWRPPPRGEADQPPEASALTGGQPRHTAGVAPGCSSPTRGAVIARSYVDSHIVLIVMSCHTVQRVADSVGCPQHSHGPGSPC